MQTASPAAEAPIGKRTDLSANGAAVRALLVLASLGAAAIHFGFAPSHLESNTVHGAFFLTVAWLQVGWALAVGWKPSRFVYLAGMVLNVAVLAVWLVSRTIGIGGTTESFGFPDAVASALELIVVVVAFCAAGRLLPRRELREATSGAVLGAAAVAVAGLVSASMVPSLSGHGSGGPDHHGGTPAGSDEVAAGADHHDTAESETISAEGETAHGDTAGDHAPAVVVPYDPDLPIDLGGIVGVSPEQQAQAENIIATTLTRLPQWADPEDAEAAGFRTIGDGGTGTEHFINREYMEDDVLLDPDKPESLVYDVVDGERRLAAAMFMTRPGTPLEDVPELGGDLMQWHVHDNLCYNAEGRVAGLTNAQGECPTGLIKPAETPMIHVWIRPHPCGPFAALEGIGAGTIADGEERLCDSAHGGG